MNGTYEWQIRTGECDGGGTATLPSIMALLQEAASLNAEELGFSKSDFEGEGRNISWVLTHLRIVMDRYPRWEEVVRVVTWPRLGRKITAQRDFEIYGGDGVRIGIATSEWMIIDLASRRVMPIPAGVNAKADATRAPVFGEAAAFARLRWDCAQHCQELHFRAKRCDIDLNGHVNNIHYAEWLLETVPSATATAKSCRECEIVFKSETLAGDEVLAEGVETAPGEYIHRVSSPDGRDHVLAKTIWR